MRRRWSQADINRLKIEWALGTRAKVIAYMIDHPVGSIYRMRDKLELPIRKRRKGRNDWRNVRIPPQDYLLAAERARALGVSRVNYICRLIRRDQGQAF